MIVKALEIWSKIPTWIKWPLAVIVLPNIVVNAIIVHFVGIPWINTNIDAKIIPYQEKVDERFQTLVERQNLELGYIKESLQRQERHQALMYQALLNKQ